jgi:CHAT domain-containing protein
VETALAGAERLVVVAEGPLLTLPFAALVRSVEPLAYLAHWKPLSHSASAGTLVELARSRRSSGGRARNAVVFGDPVLAEAPGLAPPEPLPFARRESERIGALYGADARVFVGSDASEERARAIGPEAQLVHFATHALPDARFPLDSALLLSPGLAADTDERADGRLHAWEVAEALRLEADLVTLSGCETGLGRELRGEGLLGLARAFQYAGARAVLVSLWAVSDESTAELMARFYAALERGLAKDEALREARRVLLDGPIQRDGTALDARHPYHWAAFRLIGDAR